MIRLRINYVGMNPLRPLQRFQRARGVGAGRNPALIVTVTLMARGTGMIGLAPTCEMIGSAAPMLVVFGRLLHGFSATGEVGATKLLCASVLHAEVRRDQRARHRDV